MNEDVPTYRVVLHITADSPPSEWLPDVVRLSLEDELESARLVECTQLEDRPTSIEHHGGYTLIPERY